MTEPQSMMSRLPPGSLRDALDLTLITGATLVDCVKALAECRGDMVRAEDWLRNKSRMK